MQSAVAQKSVKTLHWQQIVVAVRCQVRQENVAHTRLPDGMQSLTSEHPKSDQMPMQKGNMLE